MFKGLCVSISRFFFYIYQQVASQKCHLSLLKEKKSVAEARMLHGGLTSKLGKHGGSLMDPPP